MLECCIFYVSLVYSDQMNSNQLCSFVASFLVVLGGCVPNVTSPVMLVGQGAGRIRPVGSKPPPLTQVAQTGLGTRQEIWYVIRLNPR